MAREILHWQHTDLKIDIAKENKISRRNLWPGKFSTGNKQNSKLILQKKMIEVEGFCEGQNSLLVTQVFLNMSFKLRKLK